ncbi:ferredoxin-type protein NapF [Ferrimonas lipolytica]|uniref:Ferredoxin-type protein NapF n=1 Tax=Ferrimonas lipolytica TaxID=2724191 RepID=A0A6H1UCR7_9GAMM|nr:ferredoxin-type protein NapF [Ferrimonas lipolytica]QIZ76897.1 ferredoxin-type protein NapF [Ferrimonas lipolytica]
MINQGRRALFRPQQDAPIRMPWTVVENDFLANCTRCNQCIDACEPKIIVKGSGGFPSIDFSHNECTFCQQCVQACPEPVFRSIDEQPWQLKAQINDGCLAQQRVECRSCGDSCEPQAIRFKLTVGMAALPQIDLDQCNGCGACVSVCPTTAITMISKQEKQ